MILRFLILCDLKVQILELVAFSLQQLDLGKSLHLLIFNFLGISLILIPSVKQAQLCGT